MDPKTMPPTPDDNLNETSSASGSRQVSVDIQGSPDSSVVENAAAPVAPAPDFNDPATLHPLPGAGTAGPGMPPATDVPANPMADEGLGGTPTNPAPGAPTEPNGPAMPGAV